MIEPHNNDSEPAAHAAAGLGEPTARARTRSVAATVLAWLLIAAAPSPAQVAPLYRLWQVEFGTPEEDAVRGMAPDGTGGVCVIGSLGTQHFVDRYSSTAERQWRWLGPYASHVASDGAGRLYVLDISQTLRCLSDAGVELWSRQGGGLSERWTGPLSGTGSGGVLVAGSSGQVNVALFVDSYSAGGLFLSRSRVGEGPSGGASITALSADPAFASFWVGGHRDPKTGVPVRFVQRGALPGVGWTVGEGIGDVSLAPHALGQGGVIVRDYRLFYPPAALTAFHRNGQQVWTREVAWDPGPLTVSGNSVFLVSGSIRGYDIESGAQSHASSGWTYPGGYSMITSAPAGEGDLFVAGTFATPGNRSDVFLARSTRHNTIWVDYRYPGAGNGTYPEPFNSLAGAVAAAEPGRDHIRIKCCGYPEHGTFDRPCTIEAWNGTVTIGRP